MLRIGLQTLLLAVVQLAFIGCNSTSIEEEYSRLVGYWSVASATRNDNPTSLLDGSWVELTADKKLNTNFPNMDASAPIEYKKGLLRRKTTPELDFKVVSFTDSTLQLEFELRSQIFRLNFVKIAKPETESTEVKAEEVES